MVPKPWNETYLGEVITYKKGFAFNSGSYRDKGVRIVRISDTTRNSIHSENPVYIAEEDAYGLESYKLSQDDIILSTVGSRPHLLDSMVGKAVKVPPEADGSLLNQNLVKVIPKISEITNEYLYEMLKNKKFMFFISTLVRGNANQVSITLADLFKYQFVLPTLAEQRKIAQILSIWDKSITATEQLLANSQQQKKALMQQLLTGKKRLLDENGVRFSGEWRFMTFDDAFKVANKKSAQVKSSDYLAAGPVPVVDQGKQLIAGYCDNADRYTNVPVIVFGDHTRCLKWVDFEFCPGADGTQVLDTKEFLDKRFGYFLLCNTNIPNLGYSRHMRELKDKDFKVPVDMAEQQKIAALLSAADQEINALQKKLDAFKQEKKALMQQLLTGKRRVLI